MIPAIDSYSFHRFFGEHYEGLETDPGTRLSTVEFLDFAVELGAGGVSLEACFIESLSLDYLSGLNEELNSRNLHRVWAWGHPKGLHSGASLEALSELFEHIDMARAVGADVMRICAGGRGTRPESWQAHKSALLPMLLKATEKAEAAGVVLAIENHIDLYADEMVELMETVNSPYLGVCLDTANNLRMFEDATLVAQKLAPYTRATHIKDIVAYKGDPKTFGFWPSVPTGDGLIDIKAILGFLKAADYQGLLAIEIDYLHPAYEGEREALTQGMAYLKGALEDI